MSDDRKDEVAEAVMTAMAAAPDLREWLMPSKADLVDAFGPNAAVVAALVRRAHELTETEAAALVVAREQIQLEAANAAWEAALNLGHFERRDRVEEAISAVSPRRRGQAIATVQSVASTVGRDVAMDVAESFGPDIPEPAWDAAWAVCVADLIGLRNCDGDVLSPGDIEVLLGPWTRVIGPAS